LALGHPLANDLQVVIPYSASGITAGAILGIGRAIGETIWLYGDWKCCCNTYSFLAPVQTIPPLLRRIN
jgi:phosphate transport system permease protein